jgi:hypothetical protein
VLAAQSWPYTRVVTTIRLATVLLLSTFMAGGQEVSAPQIGRSQTPIPKLPVIDDKACPGKGQTVPDVELTQNYEVYSSWQERRRQIGTFKAGESVTVLDGVNVVREPDKAVIKYVGPDKESLSLKVGDVAFGYGIESDANDVFWAKGTWFGEWDEAVAEKGHCGFRSGFSPGGCTIDIVEYGKRDWWVQVKSKSGITGWVLAATFDGDKHWFANFYPLCHYGED